MCVCDLNAIQEIMTYADSGVLQQSTVSTSTGVLQGHIETYKIFLNLKWLVPFSSLIVLLLLNNIIVLIARSCLATAQASSSFK